MAMIYVKAKEGRTAYIEQRLIPHDKFVAVPDNAYTRRLVEHWGDLEVEGGALPTATSRPTTKLKPIEKGPTPPVPGGGRERLQPSPAVAPAPATGAPKPQPN